MIYIRIYEQTRNCGIVKKIEIQIPRYTQAIAIFEDGKELKLDTVLVPSFSQYRENEWVWYFVENLSVDDAKKIKEIKIIDDYSTRYYDVEIIDNTK